MVKTLWLTYAWVDNEEDDVDFVVQKLQSVGIDVRLDRTRIVAGQRLWHQIDKNILSADLDGFAIYSTRESLVSEPCQEELAIALDRVLREKGGSFPLIGIFPTPIERELIPSSIATRLYVSLKDEKWADRVSAALSNEVGHQHAEVQPFFIKEHRIGEHYIYEMRPRDGVWQPSVAAVLADQYDSIQFPWVWAKGQPHFNPPMWIGTEIPESPLNAERWKGYRVDQQADATQSLYVKSKERLRSIIFGCATREQFRYDFG
ncbi:toll/interleukin-1 receptor domain-containing protein [Brucella sp. BE17]|uniref:toll/interleukin-1 receptor domain-containing protein n=1 Tax=Brucella sp. BE17 TaxID=3142977 RepID=UPI0031BAF4C1